MELWKKILVTFKNMKSIDLVGFNDNQESLIKKWDNSRCILIDSSICVITSSNIVLNLFPQILASSSKGSTYGSIKFKATAGPRRMYPCYRIFDRRLNVSGSLYGSKPQLVFSKFNIPHSSHFCLKTARLRTMLATFLPTLLLRSTSAYWFRKRSNPELTDALTGSQVLMFNKEQVNHDWL